MKYPSQLLLAHPAYDVKQHLAYVKQLWSTYRFNNTDAAAKQILRLTEGAPAGIKNAVDDFTADLLEDDDIFFLHEPTLEWRISIERQHRRLTLNTDRAFSAVTDLLEQLYRVIPEGTGAFTVALADLFPADDVIAFAWTLHNERDQDELLFPWLRRTLLHNMIRVSGYDPDTYDGKRPLIGPRESKLPPHEKLQRYLADTPFLELFATPVPFTIPLKTYAEHGFLFAKSGHGKSQTMRGILASLLDQDCALFLLDGNGALIENVDKIASIKDRVVILDPEETPALNFFSMHGASREKQMELFFYLFKAIDQGLTERQATMVSYLVELMQSIPGATLDTLREVCEGKLQKYATDTLEPIARDFFANQFYSKDALINQTKAQIAARLYTVGRNRLFNTMFSAPENKFNALQLMREKKVVIVNTTRDKLGDQGSAVFGRYILAQCLAAAWQRPKHERHLALIMVDEAKTYLDDQSKKILSDARAFGVGLLLASQFPDQLEDGVRKEVINNTSVKFAGPAAYSVVAQLNRDMRCDADFIMDMKKRDYEYAEWACYVDNLTPRAMKLTIPFGSLEKLPQLTPLAHAELRRRNRELVASMPATVSRTPHKEEPRATLQQPPAPRGTNTAHNEYDTDI